MCLLRMFFQGVVKRVTKIVRFSATFYRIEDKIYSYNFDILDVCMYVVLIRVIYV
jgi:uncharacterized protein (DUF2235 family)